MKEQPTQFTFSKKHNISSSLFRSRRVWPRNWKWFPKCLAQKSKGRWHNLVRVLGIRDVSKLVHSCVIRSQASNYINLYIIHLKWWRSLADTGYGSSENNSFASFIFPKWRRQWKSLQINITIYRIWECMYMDEYISYFDNRDPTRSPPN